MNSYFKTTSPYLLVLFVAGLVVLGPGCEEYDPPPEPRLERSGTGAYATGEPLPLNFSHAIDTDTLELTLWPSSRGTRRVPVEDVEPLVGPCNGGQNDCDDLVVDLADDRSSAGLTVSDTYGGIGANFVLEVGAGLTDDHGNTTGVPRLFSVRFRGATDPDPDANIEFDDGIYIFGGSVNEPMYAVLTLVSHVRVLPDGRFALAGAKGEVDEDEVEDTSRDPNHIEVDTADDGWALFASGVVIEDSEGRRHLETEVFDVNIPVLGDLQLEMKEVRLFAEIIKDDDGNDFIDGTLTYETIVLGTTELDGGTTSLLGDYVASELEPDGSPEICDEPCGAIEGICEPPEDFPDPAFCEDDE